MVKQKTRNTSWSQITSGVKDEAFDFHVVNGWKGQSDAAVWLECTLYMDPYMLELAGIPSQENENAINCVTHLVQLAKILYFWLKITETK